MAAAIENQRIDEPRSCASEAWRRHAQLMIEFATLFLGLILGPQQVELLVHDNVAAIEIVLNHQAVGRLNQPPWQLAVDFGEELAPDVLEAVAFGSSGTEIGRVDQWLNVSTQQAEVSIFGHRTGTPRGPVFGDHRSRSPALSGW